MPIYEYVCEKCSSHHEVMQKVSDPPLKRCPKCKGRVEKILSRTSFHLKGSGWYQTDYAKKSTGSSTDKAEKASSEKARKSESTPSTDTAKASETA
jgi:putative FmdB family regulatory protein